MVMVTVQYMWIDDTSADVIKVDFEALYHGDFLVEGDTSEQFPDLAHSGLTARVQVAPGPTSPLRPRDLARVGMSAHESRRPWRRRLLCARVRSRCTQGRDSHASHDPESQSEASADASAVDDDHAGQAAADQLLGLAHDARDQVPARRDVIDQPHHGADRPDARVEVAVVEHLAPAHPGHQILDVLELTAVA